MLKMETRMISGLRGWFADCMTDVLFALLNCKYREGAQNEKKALRVANMMLRLGLLISMRIPNREIYISTWPSLLATFLILIASAMEKTMWINQIQTESPHANRNLFMPDNDRLRIINMTGRQMLISPA